MAGALILLLLTGCKPALPHKVMDEPSPEQTAENQDLFHGVLRTRPWPLLIIMEPDGEGAMVEVPYAMAAQDLDRLRGADLTMLEGKLVEVSGRLLSSGPAQLIITAADQVHELEGSFGTPGRAAEDTVKELGERTISGRLFTLPFLARNGRKLPAPNSADALAAMSTELERGHPVVIVADAASRPAESLTPLILVMSADGEAFQVETLRPLLAREVTLTGQLRLRGAWQELRATGGPVPR